MISLRMFIKSLARLVPRAASLMDYILYLAQHRSIKSDPSAKVEKICKEIQKNGYVVIEDYVSKSECEKIIGDFFEIRKRF